jgi:hypothetical protein
MEKGGKVKFYTKEETDKIIELFSQDTPRAIREAYGHSIGRTYNEIKQKAYYHIGSPKARKGGKKRWNQDEVNYIKNNWRNLTRKQKERYANRIGRTYSAVEKQFYKTREAAENEPVKKEEIIITHLEKPKPGQLSAIIKVDDVILELPNTVNSLEINGNKLVW